LKPEEISRLEAAYEQALQTLCVKDRDAPLTEMVAKKIIEIAVNNGSSHLAQIIAELATKYKD